MPKNGKGGDWRRPFGISEWAHDAESSGDRLRRISPEISEIPARPLGSAGISQDVSVLVEIVDDAAAAGVDEVHAVVGVDVAILAHRRTPIGRDLAQLYVGRKRGANPDALPGDVGAHLLLHDIFLDSCPMLRRQIDADALSNGLATDQQGEGRGTGKNDALHYVHLGSAGSPPGRKIL